MGYIGQNLLKNAPWATFGLWIFIIVYIGFVSGMLFFDPWEMGIIYIIIGTGVLIPIFFVCRRQARINKKLRENGKSITNVNLIQNMNLHIDEMNKNVEEKTKDQSKK